MEGWYQHRHTVHLFNSELFAFDIYPVSDNAVNLRDSDRQSNKLSHCLMGHF